MFSIFFLMKSLISSSHLLIGRSLPSMCCQTWCWSAAILVHLLTSGFAIVVASPLKFALGFDRVADVAFLHVVFYFSRASFHAVNPVCFLVVGALFPIFIKRRIAVNLFLVR